MIRPSLIKLLYRIKPSEIYNLAAQSHVRVSFDIPEYTGDVTGLGTVRILEAIRETGLNTKFYQASSSEMFGKVQEIPQRETTPSTEKSLGAAKVYSYWMTINYRESYGMFACNGILFNHESPRRGETFVTRKITRAVARIKAGLEDTVYLGNLDAKRDWGFAKEYVEAMWLMLQRDAPDDYVIATGQTHSVREFVEEAFSYAGLNWQEHVRIDPRYHRPAEVDLLVGDARKAQTELGWQAKTTFKDLVRLMVDADISEFSLRRKVSMWFTDKQIVVTGGAGFLGQYVVKKLMERGCRSVFVPRSQQYDFRERRMTLYGCIKKYSLILSFIWLRSLEALERIVPIQADFSMTMPSWVFN